MIHVFTLAVGANASRVYLLVCQLRSTAPLTMNTLASSLIHSDLFQYFSLTNIFLEQVSHFKARPREMYLCSHTQYPAKIVTFMLRVISFQVRETKQIWLF